MATVTSSKRQQTHTSNTYESNSTITASDHYAINTSSSYQKLSVYGNGGTYGIGMVSGITYGALSDWAMTFRFNSENDRGFWWGDTSHSTAQGAMSLTTNGYLTVANRVKVGGGETDTSGPSYPLHVVGKIYSSTEGQFGNTIAKNNSGVATFGSNSTATTIKINLDASASRNDLVIEGSTGDVGIGTASPVTKLHGYKGTTGARNAPIDVLTLETEHTSDAEYTGFGQGIVFRGSTYNQNSQRTLGRILHQINDDSTNTTRGTSMSFQTSDNGSNANAPTTKVTIDYKGDVGIGTNTPASKLHVNGGSKYFGGGDWTTIERVTAVQAEYALYVQTTGTNTNQGIAKFNYGATAGSVNTGTTVFTVNRGTSCFVGNLEINGNEVWHAGNDGAGSGLDADLLDGCEGSHYRQCVVATNLGSGSDINSISDGYWKWGSNNPVNSPADYSFLLQVTDGGQPQQLVQSYNSSTADNVRLFGRRKTSGTWDASWTEYWSNANDGANSGLDADLLDGQHGTYYLDYNNFTNKPTIPTVNNSTINIVAGAGLATGGGFTTNQSVDEDITLDLEDTNVTAGSYTSADITVDAKGRITAASSGAGGTDNYVDSISFNVNNTGLLRLSRTGSLGDLTVDLDGRYCTSSGIISVDSGDSNTLEVTTSSNAASVTPKTQAVQNGGVQLSTSGSIYSFVTGKGYICSCDLDLSLGTVTNGAGINLQTGSGTCQVTIIGGTNVTVTKNSSSQMTIAASGGGTTYNNGDCITIDGSNNIDHNTGGAGAAVYGNYSANAGCGILSITLDAYGHVDAISHGIVTSCFSDYRLKTSINHYSGYKAVKCVPSYKYIVKSDKDKKCQTGMMAHELQKYGVFHGVTGEKDEIDSKGEPVYQAVDYSALVPTLWSALRESICKIENLENKISELENCVNIIGQCVTE